jgi:hypothetical protein
MGINQYLIGVAGLARMLESGVSSAELGPRLETRARSDPFDASAWMDLSTLLFLSENPAHRKLAVEKQYQALQASQVYHLQPRTDAATLRLLVIMAPGDMTANTPVDCMLEEADIDVTMFYLVPGRTLPKKLPDHDLIFVAIGYSDQNESLLLQLHGLPRLSTRPILNTPDKIRLLTRNRVSALLQAIPGVVIPATALVDRQKLLMVGQKALSLAAILDEGRFPIIARPVASHGGKNLDKIDNAVGLSDYVSALSEKEFYVSNFIDYRSADGQFRKCRVAIFDGRPFACHMAISSHWMVHYFNADMALSVSKRNEEEQFMRDFENDFAERHKDSLGSVYNLLGLDYVVLDCAETQDGSLLIFEVDTAAIVHALDDPVLYPYKRPLMRKVFTAFREMLLDRAQIAH